MLTAPHSSAGPEEGVLAPLAGPSLVDQVADRIAEAIAAGHLPSGSRVVEADVAAELRVSRVPVREALRILQSQGILRSVPRRGMHVIDLDESWQAQLYEARVALERLVLRHALLRLRRDPTAIRRLDRVIEAMRRAIAVDDRLALNRADIAFHRTLCDIAESPLLSTLWEAIARHVFIIFSRETARRADLGLILDQHLRLRALLAEGTAEALAAEIEDHVRGAFALPAADQAADARPPQSQRARKK
jgi:DNA-binding GntR family transcriptional regulator